MNMPADLETAQNWEEEDEIVAEVRLAREAYAARFNYDIHRMLEDLAAKQAQHPERSADIGPVTPLPAD